MGSVTGCIPLSPDSTIAFACATAGRLTRGAHRCRLACLFHPFCFFVCQLKTATAISFSNALDIAWVVTAYANQRASPGPRRST